jgi:ketosteroid isomerase-like protein
MKKIYLIFILSLIFQIKALAQNSTKPNDAQEIQQLIQDSFDSLFSNYQAELLDRFYTPDFLLLEQGEVWDMDFIKTYLEDRSKNPNPVTRTNRFEFIKTEVFGERAWVAYHNWATFTKEGTAPREVYWLESASAVRTSEGWRLELLHSTRVESKK